MTIQQMLDLFAHYRRAQCIYDRVMDMMGHSTQEMYIVTGNTDAAQIEKNRLTYEGCAARAYMQQIKAKASAFRRHATRVPREELATLYRMERSEELG